MDEVAERGIAAHWIYKDATLQGGGPTSTKHFLARMAENQEECGELDEAFAAMRSDFFGEEIYVFTPRGEVKILPAGSCAIDFAYAVHSEVGAHIAGCRVDGRLTSITRPLEAGQSVEVLTSRSLHPSLDWLPFVRPPGPASGSAPSTPRTCRTSASSRVGRSSRRNSRRSGSTCTETASRPSSVGSATASGAPPGKPSATAATPATSPARSPPQTVVSTGGGAHGAEPARPRAKASEAGVEVEGVGDVQVRFAGCCSPEPGDAIVGYVGHAHGLTVHRLDCANVAALRSEDEGRLMEVRWAEESPRSYGSEVELRFLDRPRLLTDLADAVYGAGAELIDLNMHSAYGVVKGRARFEVTGKEQAERLRHDLSALDGALNVSRLEAAPSGHGAGGSPGSPRASPCRPDSRGLCMHVAARRSQSVGGGFPRQRRSRPDLVVRILAILTVHRPRRVCSRSVRPGAGQRVHVAEDGHGEEALLGASQWHRRGPPPERLLGLPDLFSMPAKPSSSPSTRNISRSSSTSFRACPPTRSPLRRGARPSSSCGTRAVRGGTDVGCGR